MLRIGVAQLRQLAQFGVLVGGHGAVPEHVDALADDVLESLGADHAHDMRLENGLKPIDGRHVAAEDGLDSLEVHHHPGTIDIEEEFGLGGIVVIDPALGRGNPGGDLVETGGRVSARLETQGGPLHDFHAGKIGVALTPVFGRSRRGRHPWICLHPVLRHSCRVLRRIFSNRLAVAGDLNILSSMLSIDETTLSSRRDAAPLSPSNAPGERRHE
jgi:hypothetical protein